METVRVARRPVDLPLSEPEGVAVGIPKPRGTRRTELSDVACGRQGSFGVVQELDAVGGEALDDGFDILDLEVGKSVIGRGGRALED